jgi:cysteine desulfurase
MAVYLDNNATTRVDPRVVAAMLPFFTENFGNASSTHVFGAEVAPALKRARQAVQTLIGAEFDHEVVFTSGGTESNAAALLSALEIQAPRQEIQAQRNEMIVSAVEHPAVLNLCQHLEKTGRAKVHVIPVDEAGDLDRAAYDAALSERTAIVSIMWANNETGKLFPIAELSARAKSVGALFHSDAVQAAGKIALDVKHTAVDMLSLSGHKLHGPKGVGALYLRKGVKFSALLRGGKQERGRRAGTENAPGIVGLGVAAQLALEADHARVAALRDRLQRGLTEAIPAVAINGAGARLPNTLNIAFACADSEALLHRLDKAGIAASSGSACASGTMEPSHVLRAMRVPALYLQGALRFSLSRETTDSEIDAVLTHLPAIVASAREKSPLWAELFKKTA